jgi:hypothetical protein
MIQLVQYPGLTLSELQPPHLSFVRWYPLHNAQFNPQGAMLLGSKWFAIPFLRVSVVKNEDT